MAKLKLAQPLTNFFKTLTPAPPILFYQPQFESRHHFQVCFLATLSLISLTFCPFSLFSLFYFSFFIAATELSPATTF
jgi:hypothetical protein